MRNWKPSAIGFACAAFSSVFTAASAAELHLVSSPALRPAARAFAAAFEKANGTKVVVDFVNGEAAIKQTREGAGLDVTLQSTADIELMDKAGVLAAGSAQDLAASRVGLAVKAGAPKPDISTPDKLKQSILGAKSIAYSAGTSGLFFMAAMQKLGIADAVKAKAESHVIRGSVGEAIAKGEAELGAQQYGELLPVAGIDIVGLVPADLSGVIIYRVAMGSKPSDAGAAKALVAYIKSAAAGAELNKDGFAPTN